MTSVSERTPGNALLKVYAYRIRRKLGDESGQILPSDPSVGYRLMPPGETRPVS